MPIIGQLIEITLTDSLIVAHDYKYFIDFNHKTAWREKCVVEKNLLMQVKEVISISKLSDLPNIGNVLEQMMIKVQINTPDELKKIGSKKTFLKIRKIDSTACFSKLCALEGAVEGIRWHKLSDTVKKDLRDFFDHVK